MRRDRLLALGFPFDDCCYRVGPILKQPNDSGAIGVAKGLAAFFVA